MNTSLDNLCHLKRSATHGHHIARAIALVAGVVVLTVASRLYLPLWHSPVPYTWQPQAVIAVAALMPWDMGAGSVLAWLMLGAGGAQVLSGYPALGTVALVGPTAGYLWAYVPVAFFVRRWGRGRGMRNLAVWLLASGFILVLGTLRLSSLLGFTHAWALGFMPFVWADAAKTTAIFLMQRHLRCPAWRARR